MKKFASIIGILLLLVSNSYANFYVKGKILNDKKQPVANAKIEFNGKISKKIKLETDKNGYFSFSTKDSTGKLTVKSRLYGVREIKVLAYNNEYLVITLNKETKKSHSGKTLSFARETYTDAVYALHTKMETIDAGAINFSGNIVDNVSTGKLTAGDINDFKKWKMWNDLSESDLLEYRKNWMISPIDRYTVQLKNPLNNPIVDAVVTLKEGNTKLWQARTDNTGKAELWANAYNYFENYNNLNIEIQYKNRFYSIKNPTKFYDGINFLEIDEPCNHSKNLDVSFVVDATGSMGDEIEYLKAELIDIINRLKDSIPNMNIRLSASFYRDFGDEYLVKSVDFTEDVSKLLDFIKANYADGGGDFPEAVDFALQEAIDKLSWSSDAISRIIFLILDAPPHNEPDVINRLQHYLRLSASKGIRIVPLTCSGIDKSTEYLMRSFALLTNGTYLFLTDDRGIGGKHLEPTTDSYSVQLLNSLILRTIYQFSYIPSCKTQTVLKSDTLFVANENNAVINSVLPSDEQTNSSSSVDVKWKYYPNPNQGILFIELSASIKELFIADITGKIIYRIENSNMQMLTIDLSHLPNGWYFIKYEYAPDKWLNGKFILQR